MSKAWLAAGTAEYDRAAARIGAVCREAWRQGFLSGCNGNASLRLGGDVMCVTRSGAAKGRLAAGDCCLVALADGLVLEGGPASTETGMHLALYRALPACRAVLHTHPRHLLALSLRLADDAEAFLRLPLFEADAWRTRLGFAPALPPGSAALAEAVAQAARQKPAVWMARHGLCATGADLAEALALTEELDSLAHIQLLSMAWI